MSEESPWTSTLIQQITGYDEKHAFNAVWTQCYATVSKKKKERLDGLESV
jgi:hypothetical protein